VALISGVLRGLSAVHQARSERGELLGLVHRDVSPQNILCGVDGVARLADFGLAKASGEVGLSNTDDFKGKLTYAAPEQVELLPLTYAADLYAVGVVLWELATGERMYRERTAPELIAQLLQGKVVPPSQLAPSVPAAFDRVVMHALARDPAQRPASALVMAAALEDSLRPASLEVTASWVCTLAAETLRARAQLVTDAESETTPSQRQPALVSALLATQTHGRDPAPAAASTRGRAPRNVLVSVAAMIAGVVSTWWVGQLLWPRNQPSAASPPADEARESLSVSVPEVSVPEGGAKGVGVGGSAATPEHSATQGAERLSRDVRSRQRVGTRSAPPAVVHDCQPPYSLDAEGIRHMKPGCE
jgi:serine/threonine-protein kinase